MGYKEPTYEEYLKATRYGRFRYRFSHVGLVLCWLALLLLCFLIYSYGEEISRHPLIYGADKLNVKCSCYNNKHQGFFVNGSSIWTFNIQDELNITLKEDESRRSV